MVVYKTFNANIFNHSTLKENLKYLWENDPSWNTQKMSLYMYILIYCVNQWYRLRLEDKYLETYFYNNQAIGT